MLDANKFRSASAENPPLIAIVAIPAAPLVAVIVTPDDPLKSRVEILPAVPTVDPLWFLTVRPPIAPTPSAVIPVKAEPSPENEVAVTTPTTNASPIKCNFELGFVVPIPTSSPAPRGAS